VSRAAEIRGRFDLFGNLFQGFGEPDSAALGLFPDRFGKPPANVYRGNAFDRCTQVFVESDKGLWKAADSGNNTIVPYRAAAEARRTP
jgi:hypothetical protein